MQPVPEARQETGPDIYEAESESPESPESSDSDTSTEEMSPPRRTTRQPARTSEHQPRSTDRPAPVPPEAEASGTFPQFEFAPAPPYARSGERTAHIPKRPGRGRRAQMGRPERVPPWKEPDARVLSEDWSNEYDLCPTHAVPWKATRDPDQGWPPGYKVYRGKLFLHERLCIPTLRVYDVVKAHHSWNAHQGSERAKADLKIHYEFPEGTKLDQVLTRVRQNCLT